MQPVIPCQSTSVSISAERIVLRRVALHHQWIGERPQGTCIHLFHSDLHGNQTGAHVCRPNKAPKNTRRTGGLIDSTRSIS
ncbi:hypothetical protein BX600DRAFT_460081 [Xylariales sp. PMI_506]|nr:hypothetical protein BX600DRAFT_460081 [Xylariales sp. PMI_506]